MITIVTGLARCYSSALMQALARGGMEVAGVHPYHEDKRTIQGPPYDWLEEFEGKALKWIDPVRFPLPSRINAKFLFLKRDLKEQAKSTIKYMRHHAPRVAAERGIDWSGVTRKDVARRLKVLKSTTAKALSVCRAAGPTLVIDTKRMVETMPDETFMEVAKFLGKDPVKELDVLRMSGAIIRRKVKCAPVMMESFLIAKGPRK